MNPIIDGCNYHTTWQSNPAMRFVLHSHTKTKATLKTRSTSKFFNTNIEDLIFIDSKYNIRKAEYITGKSINN